MKLWFLSLFTVLIVTALTHVRYGKTAERKQRYFCRNQECSHRTFIQQYSYRAYLTDVKQQITDMAVNGSGMRDTARVLKISRNTVTAVLKKTSTATAGKSAISPSDKPKPNESEPGARRISRNG